MIQKVIVGISQTSDIDELLNFGIRQFYFGFIDKKFLQKYSSQLSPNRRYRLKEQFDDKDMLLKTIKKLKEKNSKVYLALNSFFSNETLLKEQKEIFESFSKYVDGVIVANMPMLLFLKSIGYKNIILSNLFGIYSKEALEFFLEFAPKKVILPRDISIDKIKEIVSSHPNVEFECFLYGDNCRYSEAFCFSEHGYDSLGFGSLCSFAFSHKKLLKAPNPAYKQLLKHPKLENTQKKQSVKKEYLSIESLLDTIEVAIFENEFAKIKRVLDILQKFDEQNFLKTKPLYARSIRIAKELKAQGFEELYQKLSDISYKEQDSYKLFHKLNKQAIQKTLQIFSTFNNITSYKIPSRGRELYKVLFENKDEAYNYKESQYLLWNYT